MEIFFLWLWLSLPAIFWAGLFVLVACAATSVTLFFQWEDKNHILSFGEWYRQHPYTIYGDENKKAAYEKYLGGKAPKGTPNPYKAKANVLLAVLLCWLVLVPSQKDVAILVGASYALDVAKSPEASKVTSILRAKVNDYLDAEIKAINAEKKPQ